MNSGESESRLYSKGAVTLELQYDLLPGLYPMDAPDEQIKCDQRSWDDGNIDIQDMLEMGTIVSAEFHLPE